MKTLVKLALRPLIFILSVSVLNGQTIDTYWASQFKQGYASSIKSYCLLESINDSILLVGSERNLGLFRTLEIRVFNKLNLDSIRTVYLDTIPYAAYSNIHLVDDANGDIYLFRSSGPPDSSYMNCFKFNSNSLTFNKKWAIHLQRFWPINACKVENEFYFFFSKNIAQHDTTRIDVIDTNGLILRSKIMMHDSTIFQQPLTDPVFGNYLGYAMEQHPNLPNQIVFGNGYEPQVVTLDRNTLQVVDWMDKLRIYHPVYHSKYIYDYHFYPDKIVCGGTVYVNHGGDILNPKWDFQYYYMARAWNGDSLYENNYGSFTDHNRSYTFGVHPQKRLNILAGSTPFNAAPIVSAEFREILVYMFTEQGIQDSIRLYGNKNHVPFRIHADPNGDLFILSTFTDLWSVDSLSYWQLTKIPAFVIGLIENKQVSQAIYLYPNPTQDVLRLDHLDKKAVQVDVYAQDGKLLKSIKNPGTEISVATLPASLYIVVLQTEDGQQYAILVRKN